MTGIATLAFSSCSTKMACVAGETARLHIVDVDSAHAHRLTITDSAEEVVFDTTGQRLITLHRSSICIIDSMSGTKFHEVLFSDSSLEILVISQLEDSNKENDLALTAMRSQSVGTARFLEVAGPELEGDDARVSAVYCEGPAFTAQGPLDPSVVAANEHAQAAEKGPPPQRAAT